MDFKDMETAALEARKAELAELANQDVETRSLEELNGYAAEMQAINAELEARKQAEAERRALAEEIVKGAGETVMETPAEVKENNKMDIEIRNTKEYIDAYSDYIKTGDDRELRLLTSTNDTTPNGTGTVAVPEFVYDIVKTAWERNGITSRVRKAYLKGNLAVNFEISSTGATVHAEGDTAVNEETLVLGVVKLIPKNIKKWVGISDEIMDLRGEEFLRYIYDELTYQIAKKAGEELLDKIIACGTQGTTTQVGVPVYTSTQISVGLVAQALGKLSDEAENPVVIMNKATWAAFKAAQAANGYNYDPFEGLPVIFSNHLKAFRAATTGIPYAIVGDLGQGALMNFPNGQEIKFNFDDKTLATQDMNRVIGRMFVGIAPVANDAFVKIVH